MKTITQNNKIKSPFALNYWHDYYFNIDSISTVHLSSFGLLTKTKISLAVNSFKEMIFNNVSPTSDLKLLIIFKIKTKSEQFRNISYMQTIDLKDIDSLKQLFNEYWDLREEDYYLAKITDIIFTYKIININLPTKILKKKDLNKINNTSNKKDNLPVFSGFKLPNTMDLTLWGDYHFISGGVYSPSDTTLKMIQALLKKYRLFPTFFTVFYRFKEYFCFFTVFEENVKLLILKLNIFYFLFIKLSLLFNLFYLTLKIWKHLQL